MNDLLAVPNPVDGGLRHARRRRRSKGFVAGLVIGGLLLVGGGGAAAYFGYRASIDNNMERSDPFAGLASSTRPSTDPAEVPTAPVNTHVLGSDSRLSARDPNAWEADEQRTDAIRLVHLAADRKSAAAFSIPRDSWVPIPAYGEAKI